MSKLQVDKALIRELSQLLDETNLTEIELSEGSRSVRVVRATAVVAAPAPSPPVAAVSAPLPTAVEPADEAGAVRSPMVGTVYLAGEPGGAPFVKVGDRVAKGATLLIIEAMKVMNPIPSPKSGVVKQILIQNAQPVEYEQPLAIIE